MFYKRYIYIMFINIHKTYIRNILTLSQDKQCDLTAPNDHQYTCSLILLNSTVFTLKTELWSSKRYVECNKYDSYSSGQWRKLIKVYNDSGSIRCVTYFLIFQTYIDQNQLKIFLLLQRDFLFYCDPDFVTHRIMLQLLYER